MSRLTSTVVLVLVLLAGCSQPMAPVADAGVDAGTPKVSVGTTGGALDAEGLHLEVPAGALTTTLELEVVRTTEAPPVLSGVTALTPVFDFGPDGTTFASEVSVTFTLATPPAGAELPIVYWTQADGTFAPLPTWWGTDGKVHALTTHLSKAFVGRAATEPDSLLCCGGVACSGRGVCLTRNPVTDTKLLSDDQVAAATGMDVRLTTVHLAGVPRAVTQRTTPVRPSDETLPWSGVVFDLSVTPFRPGDALELCVDVKAGTPREGACLAYFDETTSKWQCQDDCLEKKTMGSRETLCGTTDHLTNFAILLSGGGSNSKCGW